MNLLSALLWVIQLKQIVDLLIEGEKIILHYSIPVLLMSQPLTPYWEMVIEVVM